MMRTMSKKSVPCAICGLASDHVLNSSSGRPMAYNTERLGRICHTCYLRTRARLRKNPHASNEELLAPSRIGLHARKTNTILKARARGLTIAQSARIARIPTHIARNLISKHAKTLDTSAKVPPR
jgi:hypothetical protein